MYVSETVMHIRIASVWSFLPSSVGTQHMPGAAHAWQGGMRTRVGGALSYQWVHPSSDVWPGDALYLPLGHNVHWLPFVKPSVLENLPATHFLHFSEACSF